ncbi:MAG: exo-alpha-sialidase [Myxococcales bacterium]|nr:exo-alpha-sialidase [Myxococcales bacterium]
MGDQLISVLFGFFACTPAPVDEGTLDVRVDHAGKKVESSAPRTCVNDVGRIFVVWVDDREDADGVWFNMSADGGATFLQQDTALSHGTAAAANPAIACAGERVYVAWEDKRDGELEYENIYLQWSDDAGRHWQKQDVAIDADPDGLAVSIGPALVAVGDRAWVVWSDQVNGAYDILLSATVDGGERWSEAPRRVDTDEPGAAFSSHPKVVGDDLGNVVVAWEDRRSGASDIYVNNSTDGGESFAADDRRLDGGDDAGASNSFEPLLALSGDHVYVVWQDERFGENSDILMNYSHSAGDGWQDEARRVESDAEGVSDSRYPALAAQGDQVFVAFQDNRAGGYDVYLRWSDNGGTDWAIEEERRMESDDPGQAQSYNPRIALSGDSWAVQWQDYRDDLAGVFFNDLYYNYTVDGGTTFQSADVRINSTDFATSYAIESSIYLRNGVVVSIWADGRFGSTDIFCAARPLGEASVWIAPEGAAAAAQ